SYSSSVQPSAANGGSARWLGRERMGGGSTAAALKELKPRGGFRRSKFTSGSVCSTAVHPVSSSTPSGLSSLSADRPQTEKTDNRPAEGSPLMGVPSLAISARLICARNASGLPSLSAGHSVLTDRSGR